MLVLPFRLVLLLNRGLVFGFSSTLVTSVSPFRYIAVAAVIALGAVVVVVVVVVVAVVLAVIVLAAVVSIVVAVGVLL